MTFPLKGVTFDFSSVNGTMGFPLHVGHFMFWITVVNPSYLQSHQVSQEMCVIELHSKQFCNTQSFSPLLIGQKTKYALRRRKLLDVEMVRENQFN